MLMKDFISYELAKKLENKGFDCDNNYGYNDKGDICVPVYNIDEDQLMTMTPCPEIHEVLKWLREEKKIHVEPCILADADIDADGKVINEYTYWSFSVTHIETGDMIYFEYERIDDKRFDSYELAALAGVEYCLDNLI